MTIASEMIANNISGQTTEVSLIVSLITSNNSQGISLLTLLKSNSRSGIANDINKKPPSFYINI